MLHGFTGERAKITILANLSIVDVTLATDPPQQGLLLLRCWITTKFISDLHGDTLPQFVKAQFWKNTNKSSSHAVFNIKLHIVFVTKYRRKTLTPELLEYLEIAFGEILSALFTASRYSGIARISSAA